MNSKQIKGHIKTLWKDPRQIAERCISVQQIAAPTGSEAKRARWVADYLQKLGYSEVHQDAVHNVYTRISGYRPGSGLLVSAHLDTVFAADVDLAIREERQEQRIFGPGLGDNSTGVAALLLLAEALLTLPQPPTDIWLVANSGEEGLGDLQGMREIFDRLAGVVGAGIVVEGMGLGRLVHRALGSQRFRISVTAPGGHSWSDFGVASAIHVLAQLANEIVQLPVPGAPRTTYNLGRIWGGRSVNTIAQDAHMELDLRSEDGKTLDAMVQRVERIVEAFQTSRWQQRHVKVTLSEIGRRPAGEIPLTHPLVAQAAAALREAGYSRPPDFRISSTDANIPLSRGIPAVCIGITEGGNAHRLEEWIQVAPLTTGMRQLLLLTWSAAEWLARKDGE